MRSLSRYMFLALAFFLSSGCLVFGKDYQSLGFDLLAAMEYEPDIPEKRKGKVVRKDREYLQQYVLDSVLSLDGKSVEIAGYMLPISMLGEKVDEFLLMPTTGACCYGVMPAFNEFVYARVKKGTGHLDNIPIRIRGTLTVEEVWQHGFFSHLYYVDVDEVTFDFGAKPELPKVAP